MNAITVSDLVLIGTTLFLAIVAFAAPYVVWMLQRNYLAPKLKISYVHSQPMSRKSSRSVERRPIGVPFYDFHFQVENEGRSSASRVEAVIEELWIYDASGRPGKQKGFWPVNLRYDPNTPRNIDILPGRPYYWNLVNIPPEIIQNTQRQSYIDVNETDSKDLRVVLDILNAPFFQANVLLPGKYGIKISLYSENARTVEMYLQISWSGVWHENEEQMFREIVIEQVKSIH